MNRECAVEEFWQKCRAVMQDLPRTVPSAWAFGATPAQADELLALVRAGTKTATASSLWDYEHTGERMPEVGMLSIVLDGSGIPGALLRITDVEVLRFDEVPDSHASAEGEGDRTLSHWREVHERFWREHSLSPRGFEPGMPVVCEQFQLLHS